MDWQLIVAFLVFIEGVWICDAQPYYGRLVGDFSGTTHDVSGTVYAEDDTTLLIRGFTYDGEAPDAFLWAGDDNVASASPSSQGFIIPNEQGSSLKLGIYNNQDIRVTLPAGKTVSTLKWLSVWCRQFSANFGQVIFDASFQAPAPRNLGTLGFTPRVHNVYASAVIILNVKQIRIENLVYDGYGPAAYFWVGPGGTPFNGNGAYQIPDEDGDMGVIRRYTGETIVLTLPDGVTVFDFGHLSLWCVRFSQDFGHVDIPSRSDLNVPPAPGAGPTRLPPPPSPPTSSPMTNVTQNGTRNGTLPTSSPTNGDTTKTYYTFTNCEQLVPEQFHVSWTVGSDDITIQLSSTNEVGEYAAFGISGSSTGTQMIGGDVVVTFIDDSSNPQVVDYYLQGQAQCSPQNGNGACPDEISTGGSNNAELVEFYRENGVTHITYRRPLSATDSTFDKTITVASPMYVIWARGGINNDGRVAYHENGRRSTISSNLQINFGRAASSCAPLGQGSTAPSVSDGWKIPEIEALEPTTFTIEMGLSGGSKGYESITGRVGWGIAWFVNGFLIPELTLKRNVTYTFLVSGGNDSSTSGNYHPFYITDDENGGYAQLPEADKQGITIYAGPEEGPLCQYMSSSDPDSFDTFADFKASLTKQCLPGDPGRLVWTVPVDAPDLLYYQCYTHKFLGWKIHVTDSATTVSLSVFNILLLIFVCLVL